MPSFASSIRFKRLSLWAIALLCLLLAVGTVVERCCGAPVAQAWVYHSPLVIALWALLAVVGLLGLRRMRRWPVRLLHMALLVILCGAMLSHLLGTEQRITLREGETSQALPFPVRLERFEVVTHPGGVAPMDYVSTVTLDGQTCTIAMNRVARHRGYRFFQQSYNEDTATLLVTHDPVGTGVTYVGYGLLFLSLLCFFLDPKGSYRKLLMPMLLLVGLQASAAPRALPRAEAEAMGRMWVMYQGRVCPVQTLAKDFTTKLYGKPRYEGLTSEQVLSGWMFYYSDWRGTIHSDEQQALVAMLYGGELLKLFPVEGNWLSQSDRLPLELPDEEYLFIRNYINLAQQLALGVETGHAPSHTQRADGMDLGGDGACPVSTLFRKTRAYQEQRAEVPSPARERAERLYNRLWVGKPLSILAVTLGLLCFALFLFGKRLRVIPIVWLSALTLLLATLLGCRWVAGGHIPLAGSYDTMLFVSLCTCLISLALRRKEMALPFGMLISGLTLLAAMMSGSNPPIAHLQPVLSSPWLLLHVSLVLVAYTLFFFVALLGVAGLVRQADTRLSLILLYPAVALLACGIFVGAVWANVSWGSYWSWDPKEVWALITLMLYALPLHLRLRPRAHHLYCALAFLSILITYFGVNLLLGGMHAYN